MAKSAPEDIDPHYRWDRPLQAPGRTQVDFEERVDFRRLHRYRLARVRAALSGSGLGALLCFDQHNIRYTTSTVIGEWQRGATPQALCAVAAYRSLPRRTARAAGRNRWRQHAVSRRRPGDPRHPR
jgi:hypothetical protein